MFNFKKSTDKGLPSLSSGAPTMRDLRGPRLPAFEIEEKEEIHGLPSFPDSPMNKGFSQSAIKSAVEEEDKNLPELPEWNPEKKESLPLPVKSNRTMEMEEWRPQKMEFSENMQNTVPQKKYLFVKLEKFKESRESLTKVSEKLNQMDELLKMIKEVKAKEDAEILEWEKDIENIKARISFINKEIFENAY